MKDPTELTPRIGLTSQVYRSDSLEGRGNDEGNLTPKEPLVGFESHDIEVMKPNLYH